MFRRSARRIRHGLRRIIQVAIIQPFQALDRLAWRMAGESPEEYGRRESMDAQRPTRRRQRRRLREDEITDVQLDLVNAVATGLNTIEGQETTRRNLLENVKAARTAVEDSAATPADRAFFRQQLRAFRLKAFYDDALRQESLIETPFSFVELSLLPPKASVKKPNSKVERILADRVKVGIIDQFGAVGVGTSQTTQVLMTTDHRLLRTTSERALAELVEAAKQEGLDPDLDDLARAVFEESLSAVDAGEVVKLALSELGWETKTRHAVTLDPVGPAVAPPAEFASVRQALIYQTAAALAEVAKQPRLTREALADIVRDQREQMLEGHFGRDREQYERELTARGDKYIFKAALEVAGLTVNNAQPVVIERASL